MNEFCSNEIVERTIGINPKNGQMTVSVESPGKPAEIKVFHGGRIANLFYLLHSVFHEPYFGQRVVQNPTFVEPEYIGLSYTQWKDRQTNQSSLASDHPC